MVAAARLPVAEHVAALRDAGQRLGEAALAAGLDAAVPACDGWTVRDLLAHIGGVHRWATSIVAGRRTEPTTGDEDAAFFAAPEGGGVVSWYEEGVVALVETLEAADPSLSCWTFLDAPSPLAFWARRQAHETAIHAADAEAAAERSSSFTPGVAADGIDELLAGLLARPRGRLVADPPVRLGVRALDTGDCWTLRIDPARRTISDSAPEEADCLLTGAASDLYLLLWNRHPASPVETRGDAGVLELWRERATIRWA